ncbi:MAG TPA: hypothetical protein PLF15_03285 [bacterium]|nr:hypothetical protein [bacterium]
MKEKIGTGDVIPPQDSEKVSQIEKMSQELEYYVSSMFSVQQITEDEWLKKELKKIYGERYLFGPGLDYAHFENEVKNNPTSENIQRMRDLLNCAGLGGGDSITFLEKLKEYSAEK